MIDIDKYKLVIFDLDGTVYHGDSLIDGAKDAIELLRKRGCIVVFLTNNSAKCGMQIADKLCRLGIELDSEDVWTVADIAAEYLAAYNASDVYVCGTAALRERVASRGVMLVKPDKARCLLIGFNPEATYQDCADAVSAALGAETIIACNKERIYPGDHGCMLPGCGAMVASVEWCSSKPVDLIIGKPSSRLLDTLALHYGCRPSEMIMVGDSRESDIAMADGFGCDSLLVGEQEDPERTRMRDIASYLK